jgi:hypothetical protein
MARSCDCLSEAYYGHHVFATSSLAARCIKIGQQTVWPRAAGDAAAATLRPCRPAYFTG